MPSSIFKSSVAAAFLASQAAAQSLNWDLIYQSFSTDFQDTVTNEITLNYLIGTGRSDYAIALFDKGCVDPITGMTITPTPNITAVDSDRDQLQIMFDLDKSAITSSNVWSNTTDKLEFCVKVQLLDSGSNVVKEE